MTESSCASCSGPVGDYIRRGWCRGCYQRWRKAGRPDSGPPPRKTREALAAASAAGVHAAYMRRYEWFLHLDRHHVLSAPYLAHLMGVTERTIYRYRAAAREDPP